MRVDKSILAIGAGLALLYGIPAIAQSVSPGVGAFLAPLGVQPVSNSQAVNPATGSAWTLGAGSAAIGSITNTSFASTQSGAWSVSLSAGSASVGNFGLVPLTGTGSLTAVTVTTTSAVLSAAGTRKVLSFKNQSASATVAVCPANVSTTATLATAGCYDIPPGGFWSPCSAGFCPSDAFYAVATASAPVTLQSN